MKSPFISDFRKKIFPRLGLEPMKMRQDLKKSVSNMIECEENVLSFGSDFSDRFCSLSLSQISPRSKMVSIHNTHTHPHPPIKDAPCSQIVSIHNTKEFSKNFQRILNEFPKIFSKQFPKNSQKIPKKSQKIPKKIPKNSLKLSDLRL